MATGNESAVNIKDSQSSANVPVDTITAATGNARQVVSGGDGGGNPYFTQVSQTMREQVEETTITGAQTNDAPVFVSITGDPTGDFAGMNLIESLMDDGQSFSIGTRVVNQPLSDVNRALLFSDAPAPIRLVGVVGAVFDIDTTGYESLNITTGPGFAANVSASDDKSLPFQALTGVPRTLGAYTTSVTSSAGYSFPAIARYIRFTLTNAGSAVAYLRAQTWSGSYTTSVPTAAPTVPTGTATNNVAQVGGTTVVTAGVGGMSAVGGNVAPGGAATAYPTPVGGVDSSNLTRRILTDALGRTQVTENAVDLAGTVRQLGAIAPALGNIPALATNDITQHEGQSIIQILDAIRIELMIVNHQLHFAPQLTAQGALSADDPATLRNDTSFTTQ